MNRSCNPPYQKPSSRGSSNRASSSAFGPNAKPNEDWTKVSDLAERRRIQNRIAQRNYRKRLKLRLGSLEKGVISGPEYQEQSSDKVKSRKSSPPTMNGSADSSTSELNTNVPRRATAAHTSTYDGYITYDYQGAMFSHQYTRQLSTSPPPVYSYASYTHLGPYRLSAYGQPCSCHSTWSTSNDMIDEEKRMPEPSILPVTLSMTDSVKRPLVHADEEIESPFNISYASMASIELCRNSQRHLEREVLTSPLSHFCSDGYVSPYEPLNLACPLPPESGPYSPKSYLVL